MMDCIHTKLHYINSLICIHLKYPPSITTSLLLYLMPCTHTAHTRWDIYRNKRKSTIPYVLLCSM